MTSSFGEHRFGHLHAGIDLKTWGKIGRRVHAAEEGYVWRVRTSPWGYGAAVYLRLADGNTVVYGHLSGFASKIARVVEERQKELCQYSVDLYPEAGAIPVARGEVIGLTGDTGIGPAHLHFELRDPENRPINPLGHGLRVADTKPPRITRIAVTPVGSGSWVNGGHRPVILELRWDSRGGVYVTDEMPCACGAIRIAAEMYDRADGASNRFGPYRAELYVDDVRVFAKRLNTFPYEDTHQVDLDRDFALRALGHGGFHSLYRAPGNRLPSHGDQEPGEGTLLYGAAAEARGTQLSKGRHTIQVVAVDFEGNEARAQFNLLMDAPPQLLNWGVEETGQEGTAGVELYGMAWDPDDAMVELKVRRSLDGGASWEVVRTDSVRSELFGFRIRLGGAEARNGLYEVRAAGALGAWSPWGTCLLVGGEPDDEPAPGFRVERVVHPEFLEVQWETTRLLARPPNVAVWRGDSLYAQPAVRQVGLLRYAACLDFAEGKDGPLTVIVDGEDGRGETRFLYEQKTIQGAGPGQVESADGRASAQFPAGAVYAPLWPSITSFEPKVPEPLKAVGAGYEFWPSTVPFDKPVTIALEVPEGYPSPERLGLYRRLGEGTWGFLGNARDPEGHTVQVQVGSFSAFALLADETPPVISLVIPKAGARLVRDLPLIRARVRDSGSGIRREEDVVVLLDGRKQISVYDPDKRRVSYQVKRPLARGKHVLEFVVRDACGNEAKNRSTFSVR